MTNHPDAFFYVMYIHTNAHTLQLIDPGSFKPVNTVPQFLGRCFVALYYFVRFLFPDVTNFQYRTGVHNDGLSFMHRKQLEDAWENKSVEAAVNAVRSSVWRSIDFERIGFFMDGGTVDERLHKKAKHFLEQDPCDITLMVCKGATWNFSGNIMAFAPQYAMKHKWLINIEQNLMPVNLLLQ